MIRFLKLLAFAAALFYSADTMAQLEIHGNFQVDVQYYQEDSAIGAQDVPETVLTNGFGNINLSYGKFNAGLRYESYQNPMLGFDKRYTGEGIPYWYAMYSTGDMEVTLGSFYEQFGSGLIFRSYEERNLGIDNAMNGIRLKYNPWKGVSLKGYIANQRSYFEKAGLVRGFDAEIALMDAITSWENYKARVTIGGGLVSKYQADDDPQYNLPENVLAFAPRVRVNYGNYVLYAEYAYKYNDPSLINATADNPAGIIKEGQGFYLNGGYSKKGLGISLSAKYIDNMSFRSDRNATGNDLNLNYLPATTKQQTYTLATLYPYATQPNGEVGFQADIFYNIKPGSALGGKYGTYMSFNYSKANGIDTAQTHDEFGYTSDIFNMSDSTYFEEVNFEIQKKVNKDLKLLFTYTYTVYNEGVVQGTGSSHGYIYAHIAILETQYKITKTNSIRFELQHLYTKQDKQSWAMMLAEYTISPHWFFAAFDLYNYGNDIENNRHHYPNVAMGYTKGANRISIGYGKQKEGILCVGGVCRNVPASNGFSLSVTSSF